MFVNGIQIYHFEPEDEGGKSLRKDRFLTRNTGSK